MRAWRRGRCSIIAQRIHACSIWVIQYHVSLHEYPWRNRGQERTMFPSSMGDHGWSGTCRIRRLICYPSMTRFRTPRISLHKGIKIKLCRVPGWTRRWLGRAGTLRLFITSVFSRMFIPQRAGSVQRQRGRYDRSFRNCRRRNGVRKTSGK